MGNAHGQGSFGRGSGSKPPSPPPCVIQVEQTVTVEEFFVDPPPVTPGENNHHRVRANSNTNDGVFGDSSPFYQATVSAASQFARNLFDSSTLFNSNDGLDVHANANTRRGNRKWIITALLLAMVNLCTTLIESMMPVMVPTIIYDSRFDVQGFQWLLAGPAIGAAATALSAGQLYAVFPFKQVYMLFAVLLLLATVSPGFAPNMAFLFYTRVLVGVGLAGQQFGALVYLEHEGTFIDKVRRDFFMSVSTAVGLILGPIFGSLFTHRDKIWGWAFYAAFAILAFNLALLVYALPNKLDIVATAPWTYGETLTWSTRLVRMDLLGCLLSFFGILTFFISVNFAGTLVPWTNGFLYIPLGIGAVLLLLVPTQQHFMIFNSPSTRLFPMTYLRSSKTMALWMLTFLASAIVSTALPYTTIYQLFTRPNPSAVSTAFYMFFTLTGPHLIPTLIISVYIGGGLITRYPFLPSFSVWSTISSLFLLTGTALLFVNTPSFFPSSGGLPIIACQFGLACIGFWTAVILPLAHQLTDLLQSSTWTVHNPHPGQKHPHHNRAFVMFAIYLGAAVGLTATGSILMHIGPRLELAVLTARADPNVPATEDNALYLLQGYSFIRDVYSDDIFTSSLAALRNAFGWSSLAMLVFATGTCVCGAGLLVGKVLKGEMAAMAVPREWRLDAGGREVELHAM